MIANQKDKQATKAAWKRADFLDQRSYITMAGHVFLFGQDVSQMRVQVALDAMFKCAICGEYASLYFGNLEHIASGRKMNRCFCYKRTLADGTVHTNLRWTHGMFSHYSCHRDIHNREVKWTRKST